jgi:hypothetical protein
MQSEQPQCLQLLLSYLQSAAGSCESLWTLWSNCLDLDHHQNVTQAQKARDEEDEDIIFLL